MDGWSSEEKLILVGNPAGVAISLQVDEFEPISI